MQCPVLCMHGQCGNSGFNVVAKVVFAWVVTRPDVDNVNTVNGEMRWYNSDSLVNLIV